MFGGNGHEPRRVAAGVPTPEGGCRNPQQGGRAAKVLRSTASAVLIVLACILVPVTVITVWVHDIALDTDRYVRTMKPLATDRTIEDAVRHRLVDAVDVRVDGKRVTADIADWLKSQGLPPRAADAVKALAPRWTRPPLQPPIGSRSASSRATGSRSCGSRRTGPPTRPWCTL